MVIGNKVFSEREQNSIVVSINDGCSRVEVCVPELVLNETRQDKTGGKLPIWRDQAGQDYFFLLLRKIRVILYIQSSMIYKQYLIVT